jgi:hypothetical protein
MSYKATMTITGTKSGKADYDVLSCHFNFRRDLDPRGMVTSALKDSLIHVELESIESSRFFGFITTNESFKGEIVFFKPDSDQRLKKIEFEKAVIAQYSESMIATGNVPMTTNITISAQKISLEGETTEWAWSWNDNG